MNTDHLLLVSYTENCQEYEGQAKDREARRQLKTSSKTRLGYTHMLIKIGIQLARLADIHQLQDENGHREGRSKQSRPDSSIQPVTQPRTRRHCHLCVYEQTCAREHSALASGEHSALASGEMHSVRSTHAA